jgi:SAM-dependent methyltransferase
MPRQPDSLSQAWDAQAHAWISWARTPGHDSYWHWHRDAFLPLVPTPGRLTLDIACGEGRVSRDLRSMGHRVLGIDSSWVMSHAAATHSSDATPAVVAEATSLPLPNEVADCAVAFMALHDIDALQAAIREIARVLTPGGTLALAIVHPIRSCGEFLRDSGGLARDFVIDRSWYQPSRQAGTFSRDGLTMTFHSQHRPVQAYTEELADAGFLIERMLEPTDPAPVAPWQARIPMFLHIRAVLGVCIGR